MNTILNNFANSSLSNGIKFFGHDHGQNFIRDHRAKERSCVFYLFSSL